MKDTCPKEAEALREYTMAPGEALWDILRKFDVSIAELSRLNPHLPLLHLPPGQTLWVPDWLRRPLTARDCLVAPGEDLHALAGRLQVDPVELLRANPHLRPQEFCPGQRVRLPLKCSNYFGELHIQGKCDRI